MAGSFGKLSPLVIAKRCLMIILLHIVMLCITVWGRRRTAFLQHILYRDWPLRMTNECDPQEWPTSFSLEFDPRVWPTRITYENGPGISGTLSPLMIARECCTIICLSVSMYMYRCMYVFAIIKITKTKLNTKHCLIN